MDFFASLLTALKSWTQTQTRIPAKAFWTQARSDTLLIRLASSTMMTRDGNTKPAVATTPPGSPARFRPTKVDRFTAMMPGVHWPMA